MKIPLSGMIRKILQHLKARRRWNRTRRWMRDRAEGRLIVGLYSSGVLRNRV